MSPLAIAIIEGNIATTIIKGIIAVLIAVAIFYIGKAIENFNFKRKGR